jgi:hypothetical protein
VTHVALSLSLSLSLSPEAKSPGSELHYTTLHPPFISLHITHTEPPEFHRTTDATGDSLPEQYTRLKQDRHAATQLVHRIPRLPPLTATIEPSSSKPLADPRTHPQERDLGVAISGGGRAKHRPGSRHR